MEASKQRGDRPRARGWTLPMPLRLSNYLSSANARTELQRAARGTRSGPTGIEVDAYITGTLSRRGIVEVSETLSGCTDDAPNSDLFEQVPSLEETKQPALQGDLVAEDRDDAASRSSSLIYLQALSSKMMSREIFDKVSKATNGKQTTVPFLGTPESRDLAATVPPNVHGFVDPRCYGGTSFDLVGNGQHEPLNVIISGFSDPEVLTRKGFQSYCRSLEFDRECFGLHLGTPQKGFIDPRGWRDQELLYRQVYSPVDHVFGTCTESLLGGNHIRAWQQQTSGAWFLATSKEGNASKNHMIVPDGYNIGREELTRKALGRRKDGRTSFLLTNYLTQITYVAGLMPSGIEGGVNHGIAVDGLTAILTVSIVNRSVDAVVSEPKEKQIAKVTSVHQKESRAIANKTRATWIRVRDSLSASLNIDKRTKQEEKSTDSQATMIDDLHQVMFASKSELVPELISLPTSESGAR